MHQQYFKNSNLIKVLIPFLCLFACSVQFSCAMFQPPKYYTKSDYGVLTDKSFKFEGVRFLYAEAQGILRDSGLLLNRKDISEKMLNQIPFEEVSKAISNKLNINVNYDKLKLDAKLLKQAPRVSIYKDIYEITPIKFSDQCIIMSISVVDGEFLAEGKFINKNKHGLRYQCHLIVMKGEKIIGGYSYSFPQHSYVSTDGISRTFYTPNSQEEAIEILLNQIKEIPINIDKAINIQ